MATDAASCWPRQRLPGSCRTTNLPWSWHPVLYSMRKSGTVGPIRVRPNTVGDRRQKRGRIISTCPTAAGIPAVATRVVTAPRLSTQHPRS